MSIISQELLRSDQTIFAPSVLIKLRQTEIDYNEYLRLVAQDTAMGRSPLEWGVDMAQEGKLSIALAAWKAAALSEEEISTLYWQVKDTWDKHITKSLLPTVSNTLQNARLQIKPDQFLQHQEQLEQVQYYIEQDWYDMAQITLLALQNQINDALAEAQKERDEIRDFYLLQRDEIAQQALTLESFPSGKEGQKAVRKLLGSIVTLLEVEKWDIKSAQSRLNLASALVQGAAYNQNQVATALGEKIIAPKPEQKVEKTVLTPLTLQDLYPSDTFAPTPSTDSQATSPGVEPEKAIEQSFAQTSSTTPAPIQLDRVTTDKQAASSSLQKSAENARIIDKNFSRAEELFREALRLWPANDTASKNYASMLHQRNRTKEAIVVLEEGLRHAQERLPFYNLLTNFCKEDLQFDKGRRYAQMALRLVGDARSEIGVLDSLSTLEIKAGDLRKALDYTEAILRLNPKHHLLKRKERLEVTLTGTSTVSEDLFAETPEQIFELDIEISPLIREDLEVCELTKVLPTVSSSHDLAQILAEYDRLFNETRKLHWQQYRERADYFLQSAKLISQVKVEQRLNEDDSRKLERQLEQALNLYTGTMGDHFYSRNNMDSARDYYLEHVRLYRHSLPHNTLSRIAKYFQTFIPNRADLEILISKSGFGSGVDSIIIKFIDKTLQEAEEADYTDIARGLLELACVSKLIVEYVTRALRQDERIKHSWQPLLDSLQRQFPQIALWNGSSENKQTDLFIQMVQRRQLSIQQQESQLGTLIGNIGDRLYLEQAFQDLRWFADFQSEWSATDRAFFATVHTMVGEGIRFFNEEGSVSDKENLANATLARANGFSKTLDETPTSLGKTYFIRIIYQLKRLVDHTFQEIQQTSLPRLEPRIVKTLWSGPNIRECHIEITNNGESPAQDVHVHILPSETGDYQDDPKAHRFGSILARPYAVTRDIPIVIQMSHENASVKDAIDLFIRLDYYDRERVKKETLPIRLRLSLQDEVTFSKIRNPYQTGLPIIDPEMFIGRDELLEELSSEMLRQKRTSALVIYGQKRSGKTSILRNLEAYLLNQPKETVGQIIPVYFSMQTILTTDDEMIFQSMFFLIAAEVSQQCYNLGIGEQVGELTWDQLSAPPGPSIQFSTYLNKIRRLPKTRLVLLIDEFTELAARIDEGKIDRNVMKLLKSLIEQGYFSCIICGIDTMPQVLSTYSNELAVSDPRTVGYLSPEAARQLIEEPIRLPDGRSRFTSPQVVDELIRLTAGSPYYIQFVCHRLVEYMNRETRSATITGADVDRVVNGLIYGTHASAALDPYTKFDNLTRYKGNDTTMDTYDSLVEGLFLYLLADETRNRQFTPFNLITQRAPFISEVEFLNVADQLEERQVIERGSGAVRQYKIIVDLFRRWINAKRPVDQEALNRFRIQIERLRSS